MKIFSSDYQVINEDRNHFAISVLKIGVWDWDLKSNLIHYSVESLEILEIENSNKFLASPKEWEGRIHPEDKENYLKKMQSYVIDKVNQCEHCYRILVNGKYKCIQDKSKVVETDCDGNPIRIIGTLTDVTIQKEKEIKLLKSLETLSIQKSKLLNFAFIVSHNLKNHANNLTSILKLNDNKMFEKEEFELYVKTVSNELTNSIENLSDLVKVQSNVGINKEYLNVKEYLKKVFNILFEETKFSKIDIINSIPCDATVYFNASYLESILLNLTSNAIKYSSPDRTLKITYTLEYNKDYTVLVVEDNGIGIDLERYGDELFGLYKTFHNNEDSNGIGLYITKNQIEALGGKIEITSTVNLGTSFKVYFKK